MTSFLYFDGRFFFEASFDVLILAKFIPLSIFACFVLVYFYRKRGFSYRKGYLTFALSISLPLIFHHLGHTILNQFDRIMIGEMIGLKEVALYSFGYNVAMVMQLVFSSLNAVWCPYYFQFKRENDPLLTQKTRWYISVALCLTLGYLTIFPELASLLGGEKYLASLSFIGYIVISYFFVYLYSFPVNIQFYYENTKFIPIGTLLSGFLNIALNSFLIPIWGIYGAVLATVLAHFVLLVAHHILAKKIYRDQEVTTKEYVVLICVVAFYLLLMQYFLQHFLLRWTIGLLVLCIFLGIYKADLSVLLKEYRLQKKKESFSDK